MTELRPTLRGWLERLTDPIRIFMHVLMTASGVGFGFASLYANSNQLHWFAPTILGAFLLCVSMFSEIIGWLSERSTGRRVWLNDSILIYGTTSRILDQMDVEDLQEVKRLNLAIFLIRRQQQRVGEKQTSISQWRIYYVSNNDLEKFTSSLAIYTSHHAFELA